MRNKFKLSRVAASIAVAITGLSVSQLTIAGAGFADIVKPDNKFDRKQTYFAYSPSGVRDTEVPEGKIKDTITIDPITKLSIKGLGTGVYDGALQTTGKALRKFVDPLPIPGKAGALADGSVKYIPVATSSKWVNPQGVPTNDDYYEIGIVEYSEKFHSDLKKPTKLRGYVQIDHLASNSDGSVSLPGSQKVPLFYPDTKDANGNTVQGAPIMIRATDAKGKLANNPDGSPKMVHALAVEAPHFLGPVIAATKNTPTRMKVLNLLPVGRAEFSSVTNKVLDPDTGLLKDVTSFTVSNRRGDIFLPVDKSILGAGVGPDGQTEYTQNRASVHLHGGDTPWISDGTPHQWITPAGENDASVAGSLAAAFNDPAGILDPNMLSSYIKGVSTQNVPDMNDPGDGAETLYYPNGHTARMEWYHDHTFGSTRLNVYAGMASGYLVTDSVETGLVESGKLPPTDRTIPMVMQDRTFVPDDIALQDARWNTSAWGEPGDSWFPHVYETVQDPKQANNWNAVGRWHYGPWFWPVFPALYNLPEGTYSPAGYENSVTTTPEGWNDTPIINGVAYPTLEVEPTTYRFRLLNATNDRMLTFNLYEAKSTATLADGTLVTAQQPDPTTHALVDVKTEIDMVQAGAVLAADACAQISDGNGGFVDARRPSPILDSNGQPTGKFCTPVTWPTDGRLGGVPNPAGVGPTIYQVANESGWLPKVATYEPTPINYIQDKGRIVVLNVDLGNSGLLLAPAERADVVIDFSAYAGKTLLVYNDSGAPVPAGDPRNDLFTGVGDQSGQGGAEDTKPGYGPNTRTMMQIKVKDASASTPAVTPIADSLNTAISTAYFSDEERRPVVAQDVYAGFDSSWASLTPAEMYGDIYLGSLKNPTFVFTPGKNPVGGIASVLLAKDANGVVTSGGSGYVHAPAVTISAPAAGGAAATAVATMKIDQIAVTEPGKGYVTAPLMSFSGGGGNGVMANAFLRVDTAASASIVTAPGTNYFGAGDGFLALTFTPAPAATVNAPAGGVTPTGYATVLGGKVTGITILTPGSGYTSIPLVTVTNKVVTAHSDFDKTMTVSGTTTGTGAKAKVTGMVDSIVMYGTDNTTPAMSKLTQGGGGYTDLSVGTFFVNMRGGFSTDPKIATVNAVGAATGKVSDVTLTHPGSGYVANENPPISVTFTGDAAAVPATATATPDAIKTAKASYQVKTKTIQELFDPTYGRLNATLGVELPFTSALTQTTLPLGYVDENTEEFADGETQIWKITHNGVDSHPVHFHLLDVQVVNRVGWDGFIQPIEPKEMGWKETVMMSPLEDIIVAVRAKTPKLPGFGVPLSRRLMDPTQPEGSPFGFTQIDPLTGNPKVVTNAWAEFGWEYVWHCHILGHEENDFMRPIKFNANELPPVAPTVLTALPAASDGKVTVSWADNSSTEFKFEVYRSDATVTMNGAYTLGNGGFAKIGDALANASEYFDATALPRTEATLAADGTVYAYKVVAVGAAGSSDIASANIGYTPTNPTAPSAPTGLAVTGTSGTQVALQWVDTSNNEVGFLIQRSVNGGAFAPLTPTTAIGAGLVNLPLNTTTFVDSGLAPNDMVSYQVASVNLAGTADCMAGAVVCTVSTVTNSAPTVNSVGVAATSANSVTLNWSLTQLLNADNQAITSYVITRTGGAGGQVTFAAAAADLSFPDTTAQGNSTYTYTVYAVNANGMAPVNGKSATSLQVTTPYAAVGTLAKPIAVASAAGVAPSSVSVIWSAATPADKYVLERSDGLNNTTGPWTTLTTVATPPVGGFPDATVAPLTSYTYRVTAYNGFGSPSQTSTADTTSVTTNASIVVLAPTLTSTVPNLTTGAVTLTWTDQATNETGFVVESSIDGGTTWTQVGAQVAPRTGTTGLTRTANVTVTAPATQFRVRALNLTAGVTTYSVGSNVVTLSTVLTAPGTPTASIFSATRVTLSWADMSNNETSFQVWRSDTGAAAVQIGVVNRNAALGAATGGTAVTFNDNNNTTFNGVTSLLQLGHTYTYYVVAVNGNKTSAASGTVDVAFVAPAAPDALIALTAHNAGSTTRDTVTLNWAALPVGSNVTYTVQRIRPANLGGGTTTLLLNSTATTFIDPNVQRSATAAYTYQIRTNAGPLSSAYVPTVLIVN